MDRPQWSEDPKVPWEVRAYIYMRNIDEYADDLDARLVAGEKELHRVENEAAEIHHDLAAKLDMERGKVRKLVDLIREAAPLAWCHQGLAAITDAAAWEKKAWALVREVEG